MNSHHHLGRRNVSGACSVFHKSYLHIDKNGLFHCSLLVSQAQQPQQINISPEHTCMDTAWIHLHFDGDHRRLAKPENGTADYSTRSFQLAMMGTGTAA